MSAWGGWTEVEYLEVVGRWWRLFVGVSLVNGLSHVFLGAASWVPCNEDPGLSFTIGAELDPRRKCLAYFQPRVNVKELVWMSWGPGDKYVDPANCGEVKSAFSGPSHVKTWPLQFT